MRKQIVFCVILLPVDIELAECDTALAHRILLYATPLLLWIDKYSTDMEIYVVIFHIKILLEIKSTPLGMGISSCKTPTISARFQSCHAHAG